MSTRNVWGGCPGETVQVPIQDYKYLKCSNYDLVNTQTDSFWLAILLPQPAKLILEFEINNLTTYYREQCLSTAGDHQSSHQSWPQYSSKAQCHLLDYVSITLCHSIKGRWYVTDCGVVVTMTSLSVIFCQAGVSHIQAMELLHQTLFVRVRLGSFSQQMTMSYGLIKSKR